MNAIGAIKQYPSKKVYTLKVTVSSVVTCPQNSKVFHEGTELDHFTTHLEVSQESDTLELSRRLNLFLSNITEADIVGYDGSLEDMVKEFLTRELQPLSIKLMRELEDSQETDHPEEPEHSNRAATATACTHPPRPLNDAEAKWRIELEEILYGTRDSYGI